MRRLPACASILLTLWLVLAGCREEAPETTYVCPPCAPHDTLTFEEDGVCPVCGMQLIEKPDSSSVGEAHLHGGSGNFLIAGGAGHEDELIAVFYHRPESFAPDSPVLVVLPGAGRDAAEYRDAWVEASERHGILILTPRYREAEYDFGDYHMGGLVDTTNIEEVAEPVPRSSEVMLDEGRLLLEVETNGAEWIFDDFDRLFELTADAVGSTRNGYDVFGHSAGGQILHRLVLFHPESRADRIVAANSGFYTLPDVDQDLPFGLADAPVDEEDLRESFQERLVVFLGAEDDHPDAGGTFLRSRSADRQGPGRLQRGRHFYEQGQRKARELDVDFRWEIEVVPGVGHDFEGMTRAAAAYLYGGTGGSGSGGPHRRPGTPAEGATSPVRVQDERPAPDVVLPRDVPRARRIAVYPGGRNRLAESAGELRELLELARELSTRLIS